MSDRAFAEMTVQLPHLQLPKPYSDELLYSVFARYHAYIPPAHPLAATRAYCGVRVAARADLPDCLDEIASRTYCTWRLSASEVARSLTLFPYFSAYAPRARVQRCFERLLGHNRSNAHSILGIGPSVVKLPKFLRICPVCRAQDIEDHGETYWHRVHQLPGVLVCPDHRCALLRSDVAVRPRSIGFYADASNHSAGLTSKVSQEILPASMDCLVAIAERSRDVLHGRTSKWSYESIHQKYRQTAIQLGFMRRFTDPLLTSVENELLDFYGESFLEFLNCQFAAGRNSNWVRNIFRPAPGKVFQPLQHILVQVFLDSLPRDTRYIPPFGFGPWKCPNIFVEHSEPYPIKKVSIREGTSGKFVASAECICGTAFTFSEYCPNDDRMPLISQIRRLGQSWRLEIVKRRSARATTRTIAREMGLSRYAVERALLHDVLPQQFCCTY